MTAALLVLVPVLPLACDPRREPEQHVARDTTITSAPLTSPMARDAVVTQIAHAHCLREARCGHVGPMRSFGDHEVCLERFVPETRQSLHEGLCGAGISSAAFDTCLRAIRSEACDDVLAGVVRLDACAARDLCAR